MRLLIDKFGFDASRELQGGSGHGSGSYRRSGRLKSRSSGSCWSSLLNALDSERIRGISLSVSFILKINCQIKFDYLNELFLLGCFAQGGLVDLQAPKLHFEVVMHYPTISHPRTPFATFF